MSRKHVISAFLSQKIMITCLSIVFEDLLASSIAPQFMPPWIKRCELVQIVSTSLSIDYFTYLLHLRYLLTMISWQQYICLNKCQRFSDCDHEWPARSGAEKYNGQDWVDCGGRFETCCLLRFCIFSISVFQNDCLALYQKVPEVILK